MSIKQSATEGLFSGFVVGSIEAYSKKLLYVLILVVSMLCIGAIMLTSGQDGGGGVTAFEGMNIAEIVVYFIGFMIGSIAAKMMYSEAIGGDAA